MQEANKKGKSLWGATRIEEVVSRNVTLGYGGLEPIQVYYMNIFTATFN